MTLPISLTQAQKTLISRSRHPGSSGMGVALSDADCSFLIATIAKDLGRIDLFPDVDFEALPGYFELEPVSGAHSLTLPVMDSLGILFTAVPDADTYFACLATLQKGRLKYEQILERQPFPTFEQVGPRGLLQYGTFSRDALVSFLFWRKWIYDLDNRAAQDTGYVFEPILANSIGGTPIHAGRSPVKRRSDGNKGRQVDCIRENDAYEFKLRVTIAASGQGRWREELDFPADAQASGYRPILVVLDPTPNPKLEELSDHFEAAGGHVYVGDAAWKHLEDEAGETMAVFLEKYVRGPLTELLGSADAALGELKVELTEAGVSFTVGGETRIIARGSELEVEVDDEMPEDVDAALPGI